MEQGDLFARLPLELLEAIVGHLDLHDAYNLRLTNSSMAAKIARAKTFFLDKVIKTDSSRDMRRLAEMTEHGRIGNALRNLTMTGTVTKNHPTVQRATIGETTITLLSQAFSNIQRHSFHGRLGSLALNVDAPVPASRMAPNLGIPDWRDVWLMAASIFRAAMEALHASQLPIRGLKIFGDAKRCSLAIDQLAIASDLDLRCSLERLEDLSLNLSNHVSESDDDDEAYGTEHSEQALRGLCHIMQLAPSGRHLKLRWFVNQPGKIPAPLTNEEKFFERLLQSIDFASVRHCCLTGICLRPSELVSFLNKVKLESLFLQGINMNPGGFERVFEQISSNKELKYLRLENLTERRLVCFDVPGVPAYVSSEPNGPSILVRENEEICSPIKYYLRRGHVLGSIRYNNWKTKQDLMLGPPDFRA